MLCEFINKVNRVGQLAPIDVNYELKSDLNRLFRRPA